MLLAAAGFLFGRFGGDEDERGPATPPLNSEYLKGLNFLLNDQNDQALEHFIRLVRVDDQTIETHFALGSLFRRRGEVDRAIRVHQNILARPNLAKAQKEQALFALAKDYLHAGLLDRAENLFAQLADASEFRTESLQALCRIYEQESEWSDAVLVAKQLAALRAEGIETRLSNYYCELAQIAVDGDDMSAAREYVRLSQAKRQRLTRGAILRARIALGQGDLEMARRLFARVLVQDGVYLIELLPKLAELDARLPGTLDKVLREILQARETAKDEIARAALQWPDIRSTLIDECVRDLILEDTVLAGFVETDALLGAQSADQQEQAVERIRRALGELAAKAPRYRCRECGFSTRQLLWQCPGCRNWETHGPIDKVRFDTLISDDGGVNY